MDVDWTQFEKDMEGVLLRLSTWPRPSTVPQGEDESDGEEDEPGDEGACITLIVYLDGYRTMGKLSNATRSATREAAASRETTDEDDAEAQLRKAVHGKATAVLPCVRRLCKRGTSVRVCARSASASAWSVTRWERTLSCRWRLTRSCQRMIPAMSTTAYLRQ